MFKKFLLGVSSLCCGLFVSAVLPGCAGRAITQAPIPIELRGVMIRTGDGVFESRQAVTEAMQYLADNNFNVVFPVVWENGVTLYKSPVMKSLFGIERDSLYADRDPLAELLLEAHTRNIAVIPCFEGGFAVGDANGRIARAKPQWLARDREGKIVVKDGNVWLNALHPEVQEFFLSLVAELLKTYNVDGVQGSGRFPAQPIEGGYDSVTQATYADVHAGNTPPLDLHEHHWMYWRAVQLSAFTQKLYWRVKAFKPNAVVCWAPHPYPQGLEEYLQDWRAWISEDPNGMFYADIMNPRIFRYSVDGYKRTLDLQHRDILKIQQKNRYMFPTILVNEENYLISEEDLKEAIRYNRYCGYNGEVFSSYAGLRKGGDRLAKVLRENFYTTIARRPFATDFLRQ
jgi:uncharacterized lipoprotein YddW (UPF0748 family)